MNSITALCLLRVTENPTKQIIVLSDNQCVIQQTYEAIKKAGLKHYVSGYTKSRLLLQQGGSLLFINRGDEKALCGISPDEVIVDGSFNDITMDEKMALIPVISSMHSPAMKYIMDNYEGKIQNEWLGGEHGPIYFSKQ